MADEFFDDEVVRKHLAAYRDARAASSEYRRLADRESARAREAVRALNRAGLSYVEIATLIGVSPQRIGQIAREEQAPVDRSERARRIEALRDEPT